MGKAAREGNLCNDTVGLGLVLYLFLVLYSSRGRPFAVAKAQVINCRQAT